MISPRRAALALTMTAVLNVSIGEKIMAQEPAESLSSIAAGEVIKLLVAEKFAAVAARFDATMAQALSVAKLAETWHGVVAQAGAFKRQTGATARAVQGRETVVVATEFEGAALDFTITFDAAQHIAGLFISPHKNAPTAPPPYANATQYHEREVVVGSGKWALPGTLTLPAASQLVPGIVLVHGSGPNDRDETVGANAPFRDLALGLASRGIAVLRYEKRSRTHGAELVALGAALTVREETIDDAVLAAELLRHTPGVDPRRVFVLGHSLGGMLAPRIARADSAIAGLIILAGTTRPLEDVIVEQLDYLKSLSPEIPESPAIAQMREAAARVKALTPADSASTTAILGAPVRYWLDLRGYAPAESARAIRRPILVLQGERDYQVTMVDFANWKAALGSRSDVTFRSYADLNHLFVTGQGRSTPAEYQQAGHVSQEVVTDIAAWTLRQAGLRMP
ncbi:MAG: alpha/beta fold hydrolase [Gemmatimonadota bacterium]